jgi:uncharacterized protein YaaN involved in tellurite resistance
MNRKRRSDTILFENHLYETPLLKKRKISYESPETSFNTFKFEKNLMQIPKTETSLNIFEFVKGEFNKIHTKLEEIQKKVQDIDLRIDSIEEKLDRRPSKKILNFIKEMEQLKIDNTPPKFQEPCPYIF